MSAASRYDEAMRQRMRDGLALARQVARERDERFKQLKASEAEADRYRVALRKIANCQDRWLTAPLLSRRMIQIARKALDA